MADAATLVSLLVSGWSALAGSVVGQAIIGGHFSNATDRAICQLSQSLRDRVAGLKGLPESHDLAQAIRLAQMQALERVIRSFRESHRQEWEAGLGDPHLTFFDRALGFCGPFGAGRRIEPDQALEITNSLERTFEGLLAEPAPGSPSGTRAALLASLAEDAVLEELRGALEGQELPAGFEREYRLGGGQDRPRFLDVFGFHFAEQIKEKPRVRNILTTGQLAQIEGLAFDGTEMLARMLEQFDALGRNLAAIEATTSRTEQKLDSGVQAILAAVSAERGIPLVALRAILAAFGEAAQTLDLADIEARLRIKADEHLALTSRLRKLSNDDPAVQQLRQQASELIQRADVSTADRALAEAARIDMEAIEEQQANLDRRRISAAATYADRAATARLSRAYRSEAKHYAAAARVLADIDPQETWRYLLAQADALKTLGDELGDNAALSEAICLYSTGVLPRAPRNHMPLEWAETQTQLGIALRMLGDRESGTENLGLAVDALCAALQERRRDRVPLKWAVTQTNLGSALVKLGERRHEASLLAEAVQVLTDALEECTREPFPSDWATAQANLSSALFILGANQSDPVLVERSVAAYRLLLNAHTRTRAPRDWAKIQNNLGVSLLWLGRRECGTTKIREAITALRAALEFRDRVRSPLEWARSRHVLGEAFLEMGERDWRNVWLRRAITAFLEALKERNRDRVPMLWGVTQQALGGALLRLGQRQNNLRPITEAVVALRASLDVITRESSALSWAQSENNLGAALLIWGELTDDPAKLDQAIEAFDAALQVFVERGSSVDVEGIGSNRARAIALRNRRGG